MITRHKIWILIRINLCLIIALTTFLLLTGLPLGETKLESGEEIKFIPFFSGLIIMSAILTEKCYNCNWWPWLRADSKLLFLLSVELGNFMVTSDCSKCHAPDHQYDPDKARYIKKID